MRDIADRLLEHRRAGWIGSRPLFKQYAQASGPELAEVESRLGISLPASLVSWLATVGFGDIDEDLSFRAEWFSVVEQGELKSAVLFAQDTLGNFYGYLPVNERIVFFSRSEPGYAFLAQNFREFLEELERRDWRVMNWVESIQLRPYRWAA
ncbi:SMI1/KNR4 family protein [Caenimonas koreensis]|uniref:SMI1/KNR4 family protein n=1 Tax=Caenimonas koreensis TaxID=367474 RepID=UPI00188F84B5|nr:SMI1/KNR4 family protein [Caenimonas koreensis]